MVEGWIFATHNDYKVEEFNFDLSQIPHLTVRSLTEVNIHEDIPETQPTIEGNAIQKAQFIFDKYGREKKYVDRIYVLPLR